MAQEGARLLVADVREEDGRAVVEEISAAGGEARFVRCDVRQEEDAAAAVAAALEAWGGLDVLVNNAAHFGPDRPAGETTLAEWEETLAVALTGVFLMSKHALAPMVAAGRGTIVNVASTAGLVAYRDHAAYIAAKGGVLALTRSLAVDYGRHNIRVNAVCPATVRTPHTEPIYVDPARLERMLAKQALPAVLTPEDVARAVLYLASEGFRADDGGESGGGCGVDGGLTPTLHGSPGAAKDPVTTNLNSFEKSQPPTTASAWNPSAAGRARGTPIHQGR